MLALACLMLFALAAVTALGAMVAAFQSTRLDIALLNKRYAQAPREIAVSWRIADEWADVRAASLAERPHAWAPLPESLAA